MQVRLPPLLRKAEMRAGYEQAPCQGWAGQGGWLGSFAEQSRLAFLPSSIGAFLPSSISSCPLPPPTPDCQARFGCAPHGRRSARGGRRGAAGGSALQPGASALLLLAELPNCRRRCLRGLACPLSCTNHPHLHAPARRRATAAQEEAFLKRYIEYCRQSCSPRITDSAARLLANEYVELRAEVRRGCGWAVGLGLVADVCWSMGGVRLQPT